MAKHWVPRSSFSNFVLLSVVIRPDINLLLIPGLNAGCVAETVEALWGNGPSSSLNNW
jgi:hypothetical protein